jgi:hypothetical protein
VRPIAEILLKAPIAAQRRQAVVGQFVVVANVVVVVVLYHAAAVQQRVVADRVHVATVLVVLVVVLVLMARCNLFLRPVRRQNGTRSGHDIIPFLVTGRIEVRMVLVR